jgi:hypothetical protein
MDRPSRPHARLEVEKQHAHRLSPLKVEGGRQAVRRGSGQGADRGPTDKALCGRGR